MRLMLFLEWAWTSLGMLLGLVGMVGGVAYVWHVLHNHPVGYLVAAGIIGYFICLQLGWPRLRHDLHILAMLKEEGLNAKFGQPPEDE